MTVPQETTPGREALTDSAMLLVQAATADVGDGSVLGAVTVVCVVEVLHPDTATEQRQLTLRLPVGGPARPAT